MEAGTAAVEASLPYSDLPEASDVDRLCVEKGPRKYCGTVLRVSVPLYLRESVAERHVLMNVRPWLMPTQFFQSVRKGFHARSL